MRIQEIRSRSPRTRCRECEGEIDNIIIAEFPPLSYTARREDQERQRARIKTRREELRKERRAILYKLVGSTASGSGTEVICHLHLVSFSQAIQLFISSHSPRIYENINT